MTKNTRDDLMFVAFALALAIAALVPAGHCQGQELPDAPSPSPSTSQCWRGVYYADGRFGTVPIDCAGLPQSTARAWRTFSIIEPPPQPGYWAFRRADEPYLRTNRETFHSKAFWLPVALATVATSADVLRNRHSPNAPAGRELYIDAYVPLAAGFGLDYLADRFFGRPIGTGVMAYFIGRHTYGAVTRRYP